MEFFHGSVVKKCVHLIDVSTFELCDRKVRHTMGKSPVTPYNISICYRKQNEKNENYNKKYNLY